MYALWPFVGIRVELPTPVDQTWFEKHYPGWYASIGRVFEEWGKLGAADPAQRFLPIHWLIEHGKHFGFCRVCQNATLKLTPAPPGAMATPDNPEASDVRVLSYGGRKHTLCSEWCERMYLMEPERYTGENFFELYAGWELSDIVRQTGAVRSDGRTLTAQPHLQTERLWTLDDLAACRIVVRDPLVDGVAFERL
jgi:hypothetical protein